MANTREELERFYRYALERLAAATRKPSLDELYCEWLDLPHRDAIHIAIRRGLDDIEAGRYKSADEVTERIRLKHGFPKE